MILAFLFVAAFGVFLALVVLMGLFLGVSGGKLQGLLYTLLLGLPPIVWVTVGVLRELSLEGGRESLLSSLWRRLPRWLVVAFSLIFSLIFLAELALFIVQYMSGLKPSWDYYIPILCGTIYALGFCVMFTKVEPEIVD